MQAVSARQSRAAYRHELRTLAYVTLDQANGGIVRNLNPRGLSIQAVAALQDHQRVRVRFELKSPRVRVDSQGVVAWTKPSGQCGIHLVDLPERTARQINEWIFGDLLESIARNSAHDRPIFHAVAVTTLPEQDGLILSAAPRPTIQLETAPAWSDAQPWLHLQRQKTYAESLAPAAPLDWLSRPVSGKTLAWTVDSLIMVAAYLLFSFVFLSITHELPSGALGLATALGAAIFVPAFYGGFTYFFGGATLGTRLSQIAGSGAEEDKAREAKNRVSTAEN